jgi:hypothetical protein
MEATGRANAADFLKKSFCLIFRVSMVTKHMVSFLPLARQINPWPAGPPGHLNHSLLASLADEIFLAERSPVAQKIPPAIYAGDFIKQHANDFTTELPNLYFCQLRGGQVVSPPVAVINRHKDIFGDISLDWRHPRTNHKYRGWKFVRSPTYLPGKSLCLAATGAETFFHLLFDSLSRIWISEKAGFKLQHFDHLIVQQDTPLLREFLKLFGGHIPSIIDLSKVRHVKCESLFVGSYQSAPGHFHPQYVSWLRKHAQGSVSSVSGNSGKVLFLSRSRARSRRLLNEDEVIQILPKELVMPVSLEKYTLYEQISLLRGAVGVIAPHGGGLSNLAWAFQPINVLELFPADFFNGCYWELSNVIGAKYAYLEGKSFGLEIPANRNFKVSPSLVSDTFQYLQMANGNYYY